MSTSKVQRLVQGYPIGYQFYAGESKNYTYRHAENESVHLYIIYDTFPASRAPKPTVNVTNTRSGSHTPQQISFLPSSMKLYGNIFAFKLPNMSGQCLITFTTDSASYIQLLVARRSLTFLRPDEPFTATE